MILISPGDCTLQCGVWFWSYDSEFTKWQHPAMWYVALEWHAIEFARWQHPALWHVALGSGHWIRQVAAPCNVAGASGMTCHWIRPNVRHIGILHLVSISTISSQSTCHSAPVCEILSKSDHLQQGKMTSCRFSRWRISAVLDFRGPIMVFLKSTRTTSIETMALNCLVFEKIMFLQTDRQRDKRTSRWTASGGLIGLTMPRKQTVPWNAPWKCLFYNFVNIAKHFSWYC